MTDIIVADKMEESIQEIYKSRSFKAAYFEKGV
jgi:hypothetical protein